MRQLRETRQRWRDRKQLQQAKLQHIRAEHRRLLEMLETGTPIKGERQLSAAWQHYSYIEFAENWILIYKIEETHILLVRVGMVSEIFS